MSVYFFEDNWEPIDWLHLPICLCIDNSENANRIAKNGKTVLEEINEGFKVLYSKILSDEEAAEKCAIEVIIYNNHAKKLDKKYVRVLNDEEPPEIEGATGDSNLNEGVKLAIESINEFKTRMKNVGYSYYRPLLFIISSNVPCSSCDEMQRITKNLEIEYKLAILPFSTDGTKEEMDALGGFNNRKPGAIKINDGMVVEFFNWLGDALIEYSHHNIGDNVILPRPKDGVTELPKGEKI